MGRNWLVSGMLVMAAAASTACSVDVRQHEGDRADVDIRTPAGDIIVRTNAEAPDTGLPVYPGAVPLRDEGEPESANVDVGAFGVGVKVAAAKYDTGDGEDAVLMFYRDAMEKFGGFTECRGEVDFRGDRPVCTSKPLKRGVQLVTGTERDQRIVALTPRGSGTEIALVHVATSGTN